MDIDGFLEGAIDNFQDEIRGRYAGPEAANVWKFAERVAELVHDDVQLLGANKDDSSWVQIRDRLAAMDLAEELDFALQARLAWHLCPSFREAARRCWELAGLLRRTA